MEEKRTESVVFYLRVSWRPKYRGKKTQKKKL